MLHPFFVFKKIGAIALDIFEEVRDLIAEQLGIDQSHILVDASIIDDLGADSIDTVEIIMSLEAKFDIQILEKEAVSLQTVDEIVNYVKEKQ